MLQEVTKLLKSSSQSFLQKIGPFIGLIINRSHYFSDESEFPYT